MRYRKYIYAIYIDFIGINTQSICSGVRVIVRVSQEGYVQRRRHPALAGCIWLRSEAASVIGSNGFTITPAAPSDLK